MALFSNTEQITESCSRHIAEFRKLFDFHSLRTGSPGDFLQIAPKLAASEGFRLDVSDLARSIRDRERGRLSARDMLSIAAIAIGGEGVASIAPELTESAGTFLALLAGVGGWKESAELRYRGTSSAEGGEVEMPGWESSATGHGELSSADAGALDARAPLGYSEQSLGSPEMKDTLARIELANLQLKVYLDDIDRRMGRIEPHLEDITALVQSGGYARPERVSARSRAQDETPTDGTPTNGVDVPSEREPERQRPHLRYDEAIAAAMDIARAEPQATELSKLSTAASADGHSELVSESSAPDVPVSASPPARRVVIWHARRENAMPPAASPAGEVLPSVAEVVPPAPEAISAGKMIEPGSASGAEVETAAAIHDGVPAAAVHPVPIAFGAPASVPIAASAPTQISRARLVEPTSVEAAREMPVRRYLGIAAAAAIVAGSVTYFVGPWRPTLGNAAAAAAQSQPPPRSAPLDTSSAAALSARQTNTAPNAGASVTGNGAHSPSSSNPRRPTSEIAEPSSRILTSAAPVQQSPAAVAPSQIAGRSDDPVSVLRSVSTGAAATSPLEAPRSGTDEAVSGTSPVLNRVAGARAEDKPRTPQVEVLHPDESTSAPAAGTNAAPRVETAGLSSGAAPPLPSPVPAPIRDIPRSTPGRTDPAFQTTAIVVLKAPSPIYPLEARRLGIHGRVTVQATVDKNGSVVSARAIEGPPLLRLSAEDAVRHSRYKPVMLHGTPTEFQTMVTLNYTMGK